MTTNVDPAFLRIEEGMEGRAPEGPALGGGTHVTGAESGASSAFAEGPKDQRVSNDPAPTEGIEAAFSGFREDRAPPAYFANGQLETLIGEDDRRRIGSTASFPWRAICSLRIVAADGSGHMGTAWFVGPRTLITAGHCVFMPRRGNDWVRSIEVIPGRDGATRPFGSEVTTRFSSVLGWTRDQDRNHDYGAIFLGSDALGGRVGYFGFEKYDDAALVAGSMVNLSGYPGDKDEGGTQWWHARGIRQLAAKVITYDIDTCGGQSGAPVWRLVDGCRYAVGIHTNGHASGNSATRIDANVYDNITAWLAQTP